VLWVQAAQTPRRWPQVHALQFVLARTGIWNDPFCRSSVGTLALVVVSLY